MITILSKCVALGLALGLVFCLIGCGSETGGTREPEEVAAAPEEPEFVRVLQTFDERCDFCHSPGRSQDVEVVHSIAESSPDVSIIAVREVDLGGGDVRLELDVRIVDSNNPLVPIFIDVVDPDEAENIRFALAKLVTAAGASNWQSYINSTETKGLGDPGTGPGATVTQSTTERGNEGTLTALLTAGEYGYRFSFSMNSVTDPVSGAAITYDRANTHRIAIQFVDNVDNAFMDFEPNALPIDEGDPVFPPAVAVNRKIAVNASCNECHIRLGFHGGDRKAVEYCVTCHNPGSTDANSGNTVDFKVMIHKIHHGENLPEVEAGGEYAIWGFSDNKHDYSTVVFPQDIRNCDKCHDAADAATPEGDNWKDVPTTASCTSCHEDPMDPDFPGFPALTAQEITDAHTIAEQVAAGKFRYNIISVTDQDDNAAVDPGVDMVKVTFSVTDPTDPAFDPNNPRVATYDILNDDPWTGSGSMNIRIGWPTSDYTNLTSGNNPGQPLSINALTNAVDNGDGTFTVTSGVISANATGTGIVFIDGHPAADFDGDGNFTNTLPVKNAFKYFRITDAEAVPRREIVDIAKCDQCHQLRDFHGNNRNDVIQVCHVCHNANATDINRRPAGAPTGTTDNKAEEAIDFKYLIHSIHAAKAGTDLHGFRTNGIVVWGFGFPGTEHDFSHVRMPSGAEADHLNIRNCEGCHDGDTFAIPIDENASPTTKKTGDNLDDQDDNQRITPTAAVCSSCHDSTAVKTHMAENGGVFDFVLYVLVPVDTGGNGGNGGNGGQSQADLCGPSGTQPGGHSTRTDCCSCHSLK